MDAGTQSCFTDPDFDIRILVPDNGFEDDYNVRQRNIDDNGQYGQGELINKHISSTGDSAHDSLIHYDPSSYSSAARIPSGSSDNWDRSRFGAARYAKAS
jgi:hypothetical protein